MSIGSRNIHELFPGCWSLSRQILSNLDDFSGSATGTATFDYCPEANEILYVEKTQLKLTNTEGILDTTKRYKFLRNDSGVWTKFEGLAEEFKRMFDLKIILAESILQASGEYVCGSDNYNAIYEFHSPDKFTLKYTVKGPSKNYQTFTTFYKINN